uniref:putative adhesin n=1 Tax=Myroides odoratus TaxID=256 RepID=UPI003342AF12
SLGLGIAGMATGAYSKPKKGATSNITRNRANSISEEIPLQGLGRRDSLSEGSPFPPQRIQQEDVDFLLDGGKEFGGTYLKNGNPLGENSLFVLGHGERSGGTFTTDRDITFLAPLNTYLSNKSVVNYLGGGANNFKSVTYRAGTEIPNLRLSGPDFGKISAKKSIELYKMELKYNFPHTFFAINTPIPYVNLKGLVLGFPKKYENITFACCTKFYRRYSI